MNRLPKTFQFLIEACTRGEKPQAGSVPITGCYAEQETSAGGEENDLISWFCFPQSTQENTAPRRSDREEEVVCSSQGSHTGWPWALSWPRRAGAPSCKPQAQAHRCVRAVTLNYKDVPLPSWWILSFLKLAAVTADMFSSKHMIFYWNAFGIKTWTSRQENIKPSWCVNI